jgi:hypothetical protein
VKRGLFQSYHKRASNMCQEHQDLCNEIGSLRWHLQLNGCPWRFTGSVINCNGRSRPSKEVKPLCSVYIPYVKDISEKFKRTGNQYNIRAISELKTLLGVHSWKPCQTEIHIRRHSKSTAVPVNVAEDTGPQGPLGWSPEIQRIGPYGMTEE